jgi:hypothetical protein
VKPTSFSNSLKSVLLKPVILTTREAEIRRIAIPGQSGKKFETPSQLEAECSGEHLSEIGKYK